MMYRNNTNNFVKQFNTICYTEFKIVSDRIQKSICKDIADIVPTKLTKQVTVSTDLDRFAKLKILKNPRI